jgi:single-stranded DNA-binding protein
MGNMLFIGTDLRVASEVTFIPGVELKRNHAILTVMNNRGKNPRTQEDMTDEITLNFWSKYAGVAAHYLYPGKQINVRGRIQSYTEDTGQVRQNGGRKLNRKIEVVVENNGLELLGDSMKKINERIAKNITVLKAAGRLAPEVVLSAEELLKTDKLPMTDFTPAVSSQTGRYGLARVWSKDGGFWDQRIGQVAPAAPAVTTAAPAIDLSDPAALAAHIASLQSALAAATKVEAPVVTPEPAVAEAGADPFLG